MTKLYIALFAFIFMIVLTGCVGTTPIQGFKAPIFSTFKAPITTQTGPIDFGDRVGTSTNRMWMSLWSSGDFSVETAAKSAGITKITHIEYDYTNSFLFMYQEMTLRVYGYGK